MTNPNPPHAGTLIAEVLRKQGVEFLFTLCGGHISPILVAGEAQGLRIIDTRHEATAVFAADAVARLTGVPGVAAVTAGPGLTNAVTAVKNAQMAQSPLIILGGATATLLKGRGSLQDIDQMALMKPHVKWATSLRRVSQIVPSLEKAFALAQAGLPGPVFLELPLDLLYPEEMVRRLYAEGSGRGRSLPGKLLHWYLNRHVNRLFQGGWERRAGPPLPVNIPTPRPTQLGRLRETVAGAQRPVLVIGSQAMLAPARAEELQQAVQRLGIPTYLSGMARGLLGLHPLHMRHKRTQALREADLVILAGVPCDFRLGYGRTISSQATYVAINRSREALTKNRRPDLGLLADPGQTLQTLAQDWTAPADQWQTWRQTLAERNAARDEEIAAQASAPTDYINPIHLCRQLEAAIGPDSVIIGDGGDFVATASYIVRPRRPLSWLDPGPFGTLGAGAGFALAAKLVRPQAEVWLLYGDGSVGYSLAEFDTFSRHKLPVMAVVGSDASWAQIAREQVETFGTGVGTELVRSPYHLAAQGYGGQGLLVSDGELVAESLQQAKQIAAQGSPVLLNAWIGRTDFRKGSISI